jgi:hypothetical protein
VYLLWGILGSDSHAQFPAGDLTVTVEEQENGDVKFTLSGTAQMQGNDSFSTTNYAFPNTPPTTGFGSYGLPSGLTLTVPGRMVEPCQCESPEELPAAPLVLPIDSVQFSTAGWFLGFFKSGPLQTGDPVTGSGTVVSDQVPFHLFVPGTFLITPDVRDGEPEPSAEEVAEGRISYANSAYYMTYEVIPYSANPKLTISKSSRFPRTRVRRSSGSQVLTVTNRGNVLVRNLSVALKGRDPGDFSHDGIPVVELAPGDSTRVTVGFKPLRRGLRTADLEVSGLFQPPMPTITAEPEEAEPPAPDPVAVSATATLEGTGFTPKPKPKPIPDPTPASPRFPRGI